jgi:large subunit ribosomal protein L30e
MVKTLEKLIKDSVSQNKFKCGTKEVLKSVKGSKLIVLSRSISPEDKTKIEQETSTSNIPIYQYDGNSFQLGKLCSKPFRITMIAVKSGSDEEIKSLLDAPVSKISKKK